MPELVSARMNTTPWLHSIRDGRPVSSRAVIRPVAECWPAASDQVVE
jgi:hypothetical protein